MNMRRYLLVAGLAGLLWGCSDDTNVTQDSGTKDTLSADFTNAAGDAAATCGPGIYPCGPYGTKTGDVVENIELFGYMDPDELCKANDKKQHDYTKLHKLSFKDFYQGSKKAGCAAYKKSLLWVMISSGWCGPCKSEVSSTQVQYGKDQVDKIVGLMNILNDSDSSGIPPNALFIKTWATTYNLSLPVLMDPSFKTGVFFGRNAVPFNMLIDLKTMKIFYQQVGGSLTNIGAKISEYKSK